MTDFTGHAPERPSPPMLTDWMTEEDAAQLLRDLVTVGRNGLPLAPVVMEAMRQASAQRPSPRAPSGSPAEVPPNWRKDVIVERLCRDALVMTDDSRNDITDVLVQICDAVWRRAQQ